MQLDLKGKKALVTGSSRGIGLNIARILSREGCVLALNARNADDLAATAFDWKRGPAIVIGAINGLMDCFFINRL